MTSAARALKQVGCDPGHCATCTETAQKMHSIIHHCGLYANECTRFTNRREARYWNGGELSAAEGGAHSEQRGLPVDAQFIRIAHLVPASLATGWGRMGGSKIRKHQKESLGDTLEIHSLAPASTPCASTAGFRSRSSRCGHAGRKEPRRGRKGGKSRRERRACAARHGVQRPPHPVMHGMGGKPSGAGAVRRGFPGVRSKACKLRPVQAFLLAFLGLGVLQMFTRVRLSSTSARATLLASQCRVFLFCKPTAEDVPTNAVYSMQVHLSLGSIFSRTVASDEAPAEKIGTTVERKATSGGVGARQLRKELLLASHGRLMWMDVDSGEFRVRSSSQ